MCNCNVSLASDDIGHYLASGKLTYANRLLLSKCVRHRSGHNVREAAVVVVM